MRKLYIIILCFASCVSLAQEQKRILIRSCILDQDSIPVFGAYIISFTDERITTTDDFGMFSMHVLPGDSLRIHHISLERKIIGVDTIPKIIVIKPSMMELSPIVVSPTDKDMENVKKMMDEIKSMPINKIPDDIKGTERMKMVVDNHGSLNKGFSQFFGYTTSFSIGEAVSTIRQIKSKIDENREHKKQVAHYHFYKAIKRKNVHEPDK